MALCIPGSQAWQGRWSINVVSIYSILCIFGGVKMKVGLVLEGGAMRGMYTAGILDIMLDQNICVDGVIGVSAGVLFGVNYLSKQRGRSIRYNKRFNGDKRYMGIHSLLTTGNIVNTEFAYYTVPYELDVFDDETFRKSGIPFYAVVTNMQTGKPEYIQIHSVLEQMEVLRASASMPLVSKPVYLDGVPYLDGRRQQDLSCVHVNSYGRKDIHSMLHMKKQNREH